ncbi:hypothetical protein B0H14DRAFT_916272 [Mycena olivaceomarginata]|nr:hypothetical protein B0H14DRAFT_916272 [Mycena olivaceomarginata]
MRAHVLCMQLHAKTIEGERQSASNVSTPQCARFTARLRCHLTRAMAPPTPYDADTLDNHASARPSPDPHRQPHRQPVPPALVVPHPTFVASPGCATVLTSVPPHGSTPAPCRALQYHPQHVRRPQRTAVVLWRLLIRHHHILSLSLDARRWAHPQHDTNVPQHLR